MERGTGLAPGRERQVRPGRCVVHPDFSVLALKKNTADRDIVIATSSLQIAHFTSAGSLIPKRWYQVNEVASDISHASFGTIASECQSARCAYPDVVHFIAR
jgi:hypothetical protein